MFDLAAVGLVITALCAYLNHRYLRLPMTIGVMGIALLLSLALIGLDHLGFQELIDYQAKTLRSIDFSELLMQGMLSVLLFAGALHVDLSGLSAFRWQIGALALLGTIVSTLLIAAGMYYVLPWTGHPLPLGFCLVFGALISPTDPIAVMNMLSTARGPKELSTVIAGESLFNDGVGVVLFTLIGAMVFAGNEPTLSQGLYLFARAALGGLAFGAVLGFITRALLRRIEGYQEAVLVTLAAVVGGYALANHLETSGPLAMVVMGVTVGSTRGSLFLDQAKPSPLSLFWELLDAIFNAVLFVLLGLEVIVIPWGGSVILASAAAVIICLAARWLSAGGPVQLLTRVFKLPPRAGLLLTWGGLRGGISVALALSLPMSEHRDLILSLTYSVVVVSILVQGLTFGRLVRACLR